MVTGVNAVQRQKLKVLTEKLQSTSSQSVSDLQTDFEDQNESEEELQGCTRTSLRRGSPFYKVSNIGKLKSSGRHSMFSFFMGNTTSLWKSRKRMLQLQITCMLRN